jgi:hypothetical protein
MVVDGQTAAVAFRHDGVALFQKLAVPGLTLEPFPRQHDEARGLPFGQPEHGMGHAPHTGGQRCCIGLEKGLRAGVHKISAYGGGAPVIDLAIMHIDEAEHLVGRGLHMKAGPRPHIMAKAEQRQQDERERNFGTNRGQKIKHWNADPHGKTLART